MSETVIREVFSNVWTFSRPFARYNVLPFGGRSTALKLRDGGVWVLASTPLDSETKSTIDSLGPVKYIVSADALHYLFVRDFKKAYPEAKLYACQDAVDNLKDDSLKFDGVWGRDPPETKYEFENEVPACYFSGFKNKDIAFLHRESKTLIQADLLFNLPATEQYSKSPHSAWNPLHALPLGPTSWFHTKVAWNLGVDKDAMRRDVKTVSGWDFDRIIPCHGDVIETDGKAAWNKAYSSYGSSEST
ncbi:hypothetical protein BDN72DRAFT_849818 [Pluteus cervinus]|uniref:Uncharacterized protein n=1 Tax=Pluteus cervinus TaxID=181527 RepID=A0ACD3A6I4_9AGAR|nr:hypothetical protein BDN72DRAFT_849818 [Pluteus cervinus]